MKIDVMLTTGWPSEAPDRARALKDLGVDGLFTFENAHDVFLPLATAATAVGDVDSMTNVAIAFPRSPLHLGRSSWGARSRSPDRFGT